jgi:Mn2+/Fe2+ NRAMP family transporter
MGDFVNPRITTIIATLAAAIILALNLVLVLQSTGWHL